MQRDEICRLGFPRYVHDILFSNYNKKGTPVELPLKDKFWEEQNPLPHQFKFGVVCDNAIRKCILITIYTVKFGNASVQEISHDFLRHCATSREVVGSRPDEVNELFQFT
jgi:hypothetical protein